MLLNFFKKKKNNNPIIITFKETRQVQKMFNNCNVDQQDIVVELLKKAIAREIIPEDNTPESLYKAEIQRNILFEYFQSCKKIENEMFDNGEVYFRKLSKTA